MPAGFRLSGNIGHADLRNLRQALLNMVQRFKFIDHKGNAVWQQANLCNEGFFARRCHRRQSHDNTVDIGQGVPIQKVFDFSDNRNAVNIVRRARQAIIKNRQNIELARFRIFFDKAPGGFRSAKHNNSRNKLSGRMKPLGLNVIKRMQNQQRNCGQAAGNRQGVRGKCIRTQNQRG